MNWQTPGFAAAGIAAGVASILAVPGTTGLFGAGLALLMAAIAWSDWRDFVIPDVLSGAAFALGLVAAVSADADFGRALIHAVLRGVLLAAAFLAIRVGYNALRGRHGLGLGDVKLAGVAGVWLDWRDWPVAIEIAALSALAAMLLYRVVTRKPLQADMRLPFGLFLAPAIWITWLISPG